MLRGKVLGNRYRIDDRLGGGGMAVVYRAEDLYLGRPVAVKVLRSQFGADEEFVRRFRREAQAAARLSHPNIVAIYDVGEENDLYYIVMELVEGRTLKDRIQAEGPLPVDEAARIAIAILEALDHAHSHRIVHRDIKPHNILLARDGRVKVTDFGIARANTTDTVTHTGAFMGSAHYFSPEMAQGQAAGDKSDLYSLGVVLYEMVTGRVPFLGDSPISVALKHVQEEVLPPSALNPEVPAELEEIILRALEKDPQDRYASAAAMRDDLQRFLAAWQAGQVRAVARDFPTQEFRVRRRAEGGAPRRRFRWGLALALALVFALLGAAAAGAVYVRGLLAVPDVQVPSVTGLPLTEAQVRLSEAGLQMRVVGLEYSNTVPSGAVTWQSEEPGKWVKQGRQVDLKVSQGPRQVAVPRLVGLPLQDALDELQRTGLKPGAVTQEPMLGVPQGRVADQSPAAGQQLPEGSAVDLKVSAGALEVPALVGKTLDEAQRLLASRGLELGTVDRRPDARPKDAVLDQAPAAGTPVAPGARVNLVVSAGPDLLPQEARVTIEVRGGVLGLATVRVDRYDGAGGPVTVHEGLHATGEKFPLTVRWQGKGRLLVYTNGKLSYEIPLPPPERQGPPSGDAGR